MLIDYKQSVSLTVSYVLMVSYLNILIQISVNIWNYFHFASTDTLRAFKVTAHQAENNKPFIYLARNKITQQKTNGALHNAHYLFSYPGDLDISGPR